MGYAYYPSIAQKTGQTSGATVTILTLNNVAAGVYMLNYNDCYSATTSSSHVEGILITFTSSTGNHFNIEPVTPVEGFSYQNAVTTVASGVLSFNSTGTLTITTTVAVDAGTWNSGITSDDPYFSMVKIG